MGPIEKAELEAKQARISVLEAEVRQVRTGRRLAVCFALAGALAAIGLLLNMALETGGKAAPGALAAVERTLEAVTPPAELPLPGEAETPEQVTTREETLAAYLDAVATLDRALAVEPKNPALRERRAVVGEGLGRVALAGRDYNLARKAFGDLTAYGVSEAKVEALIGQVTRVRTARLATRRARLEQMVADIGAGLTRAERHYRDWTLEDYVFAALAYKDVQTVMLVGSALEPLRSKGQLRGREVVWTEAERDMATFACRVLGRIGLAEANGPLASWSGVVWDPELAVEVGIALCNTRRVDAHAALIALRTRLGPDSAAWGRVRPFLGRVPEPTAVGGDPKTPAGLVTRGLSRAETGDLAGAIDDFRAAIRLDPKNGAAYNNLGNALQRKGDLDAAIAEFGKALAIDPKDARALTNRGGARLAKGDKSGAVADCSAALAIDPKLIPAYLNRAVARISLGDLEAAIADATRVLELNARSVQAFVTRGRARIVLRDLPGAMKDFDKAVELDPRSTEAYNGRGQLRSARGDFDDAISDFTTVIELDPKNHLAYGQRGNARYAKRNLPGAIADQTQAIALQPGFADHYFNRAIPRQAKGDLGGAIKDYLQAISLRPTHWPAMANLGKAYADLGKTDDALRSLKQAYRIAPGGEKAKLAREINRLEGK